MVVLGCKLHFGPAGGLLGPAKRRADAAAQAWKADADAHAGLSRGLLVIVTGGRMWSGVVEADALEQALVERGVPKEYIVRERCSFHTVDNARFTGDLLARRSIREIVLVTCDWHLARARRIFERHGMQVHEMAAVSPRRSVRRRIWRWGRERVAGWLSAWTMLCVAAVLAMAPLAFSGCKKSERAAAGPDASLQGSALGAGLSDAASVAPVEWSALDRAEDRRRASEVSDAMIAHPDVRVRRRAARALARIADDASIPGLMRALSDEDETVVAWGAYGLGYTCKGKEDAHVAALSARASLLSEGKSHAAAGGPENLDARWSIARALGRCGVASAESLLVTWVRARGAWAEGAAYGLGDIATARPGASLPGGALSPAASLGDDAIKALLDAASSSAPVSAALYGLGRIKRVPDAFVPRLVEVAHASLANAAPERIFAVRALSHAGPAAAEELANVARERTFTAAERAEAARGLGQLDAPGRQAAGDALVSLAQPLADPIAVMALAGDEFGVLVTLVESFHGEPPKSAEPALQILARLNAPGEVPAVLARRLAALRCAAASALAKDAYESELLSRCDAKGTAVFERARLASLLRKPLTAERKSAWAALTSALRSGKPGLVAGAAEAIEPHPERMTLAGSPRRPDPAMAAALVDGLNTAWSEDLLETKAALLDAAAALGLKEAQKAALAACGDPNVTLRRRAAKVLASLDAGVPSPQPSPGGGGGSGVPSKDAGGVSAQPLGCPAPVEEFAGAPEIEHLLVQPAKLVLETDAGRLSLVLDPTLSPVTVSRLVALAQSGFYKEMLVHRVVPGFVVQFGDPGGDGSGGSGRSLRCETSPVPFEPLTVGMALAGRDTGSSQLFVTLSRTPHLDGNYTRIGRAEGDWAAVAQGDVIHDVRVEPAQGL